MAGKGATISSGAGGKGSVSRGGSGGKSGVSRGGSGRGSISGSSSRMNISSTKTRVGGGGSGAKGRTDRPAPGRTMMPGPSGSKKDVSRGGGTGSNYKDGTYNSRGAGRQTGLKESARARGFEPMVEERRYSSEASKDVARAAAKTFGKAALGGTGIAGQVGRRYSSEANSSSQREGLVNAFNANVEAKSKPREGLSRTMETKVAPLRRKK